MPLTPRICLTKSKPVFRSLAIMLISVVGGCTAPSSYDDQLVDRDRLIHSMGGLEKYRPGGIVGQNALFNCCQSV